MKRYWFLLCFLPLLISGWLYSQNNTLAQHTLHSSQVLQVTPGRQYEVMCTHRFTAIAVQVSREADLQGMYLIALNDTFLLTPDRHVGEIDGKVNANLISFKDTLKQVTFYSGTAEGVITIHFLDGSIGKSQLPSPPPPGKNQGCAEPASIDQSVWRNGLPDPDYSRIFTTVRHVIVHHSAGSNTNTNYTQVVRDIYLYHTQVNNWSDIGYNYLIAQDGTIFKGRDPDGGDQDNVQGAHFCGMNSNTMGICLLGTYTDINPSTSTVNSLLSMVTWKLYKEERSPHDYYPFSGIDSLAVFSGHRDGCSTECPGQKTYDLIPGFRDAIQRALVNCRQSGGLQASFIGTPLDIEAGETVYFHDLSSGEPQQWTWSFEGGTPGSSYIRHPAPVTYYAAGVYDVTLIVGNGAFSDTLKKESLVRVFERHLPRVFPNPVNRGEPLTLETEFTETIRRIFISDVSGKIIIDSDVQNTPVQLDVSALSTGQYFLHIVDTRGEKTLSFSVL